MSKLRKRYQAHVTILSDECPEPWEVLDVMDWDEKRPLLEKYAKHSTVEFSCLGSERDEVMESAVKSFLALNPGFEVVYQTVPAFAGWAES